MVCRSMSTANLPPSEHDEKTHALVYSDESTFQLLNKYLVYQACRFPFIIKNASKIVNMSYKVLGHGIVNFMIERTIGKVFTAGKNIEDLVKEMDNLSRKKVYSVADLSIEDVGCLPKEYLDANRDQNADILKIIANNPLHTMALKVTALTYLPVLKTFNNGQKKLYDLFVEIAGYGTDAFITKSQVKNYLSTKYKMEVTDEELNEFFVLAKRDSTDKDPEQITAIEYYANIHAFPIDPQFKIPLAVKIAALDSKTISELEAWISRINCVLKVAKRVNAYLMVDAEQTFIQYGIDSIARQLQRMNNKDKAMIMNTYQSSLKRTYRNVCLDLLGCAMMKQSFGAKLVRGAYVTEENKIALDYEVESPAFPNKALVDKSYNKTMSYVLNNIPFNSHFTVASHNDTSIEIAESIVLRRRKELVEQKVQISFAQLKGLSDKLTYGLAAKGHYTFKYVPYGPTNNLVPYLFRRAEEASYIWVEGQKKLVDIRHELFDIRKVHYKAGGVAGVLFGLLLIL